MGTDFSSPLARSSKSAYQFSPFQNALFNTQQSANTSKSQTPQNSDTSLIVDIGRISLDSVSHNLNGLKANPTSEQNLNPYSLNYRA
jgi:hypothetical protein